MKKYLQSGVTLVEIIIAFAIFMLFLTAASTLFTQGNRLFLRGTWKITGSKNLQIFGTQLKEDMDRAGNALKIQNVAGFFKLTSTTTPIYICAVAYNQGKFPDDLRRGLEVADDRSVKRATFNNFTTTGLSDFRAANVPVPVLHFNIFSANRVAVGDANTGSWIGVVLYLRNGNLYYLRTNKTNDVGLMELNGVNNLISVPGVVPADFSSPWVDEQRFHNKDTGVANHQPVVNGVSRVAVLHQTEQSVSGPRVTLQVFIELRQLDGATRDKQRRLYEVITGGLPQEVTISATL